MFMHSPEFMNVDALERRLDNAPAPADYKSPTASFELGFVVLTLHAQPLRRSPGRITGRLLSLLYAKRLPVDARDYPIKFPRSCHALIWVTVKLRKILSAEHSRKMSAEIYRLRLCEGANDDHQ
jgi:hypothetical protein